MPCLLAYYVHNLDPIIFHFWFLTPRWYGVAYLMGFLGAYLLLKKLASDGMLRLKLALVPDMVLNSCIFGVLIGGRLGFVLFYDLPISLGEHRTPLLWSFSDSFPWWGLLRVNEGGMSAHGGIAFTILTIFWFVVQQNRKMGLRPWAMASSTDPKPRVSFVNVGDAACMVVPIGLFFGRIANFINGELYGHPTSVPWAVKFPSEVYAPTNGTMLPSVRDKLSDMFYSLGLQSDFKHPLDLWGEAMKTLQERLAHHDPSALNAVADIIPARHPSQLYEACLEGLLLFLICWTIGRLWRKDGMASGAFLTLYPVMRIIGEQFRVGDTPANLFGMEISKGVLYSVPMLLAGMIYWGYWIRKDRRFPWVPQSEPVEGKMDSSGKAAPETK